MQNEEEIAFHQSSRRAEKAFMGAILLDNTLMDYAVKQIRPSSFVISRNGPIFAAMVELHKKNQLMSPQAILDEMKEHGIQIESDDENYILSLIEDVPMNLTKEKNDHFQRFALMTTFMSMTDVLLSNRELPEIGRSVADKFAQLRHLQGVDPLQIERVQSMWREILR